MAHATAVHPKINAIAAIRLNMVVCAPTLSAATPPYLVELALSSTFHYKAETRAWICLVYVGADFSPPSLSVL